jgi:hypothetical protein
MPSTAAMAHTPSDMPTASPTVSQVCEGAVAAVALLTLGAAVDDVTEDDVLGVTLLVLVEELDVEVRLAVGHRRRRGRV